MWRNHIAYLGSLEREEALPFFALCTSGFLGPTIAILNISSRDAIHLFIYVGPSPGTSALGALLLLEPQVQFPKAAAGPPGVKWSVRGIFFPSMNGYRVLRTRIP